MITAVRILNCTIHLVFYLVMYKSFFNRKNFVYSFVMCLFFVSFQFSAGGLFCLYFLLPYLVPFQWPSIKTPTNIAQWREYCIQWRKCENRTAKKRASLQDSRCLKLSVVQLQTDDNVVSKWMTFYTSGNRQGVFCHRVMQVSHKQWLSAMLWGKA